MVIKQLLVVHGMRSKGPPASPPEALRARLQRALDELSAGHLDVGPAYVQWAGYPAGLLLEVGDAASPGGPLAAPWAKHLGWLGWQPPDPSNDNAWFQAENPHAVDLAVDLIVRTREVVLDALAAPEEVHELTAEDLGLTPGESAGAREIEQLARDLPELLEVLGCSSVAALEDVLWDEFDDPDAYIDLAGGEVVVVTAGMGVVIEFPTTASEFWDVVRDHFQGG